MPLDAQSGFVCNHNMCEAVSLDSVLSNGDIVCFAPSLDSAIDRSRLTTGGTTGETTGTAATREGDAGGAQPLTLTLTLTLALTLTRTRTRTLTLTLTLTRCRWACYSTQ